MNHLMIIRTPEDLYNFYWNWFGTLYNKNKKFTYLDKIKTIIIDP